MVGILGFAVWNLKTFKNNYSQEIAEGRNRVTPALRPEDQAAFLEAKARMNQDVRNQW